MELTLEKAARTDAEAVRALIRARIAWMDERGINSWNRSNYLETYPASHFEACAERGELHVCRGTDGALMGALILLEEDTRWSGRPAARAYYIHTLVTALDAPHGTGRALLETVETMARRAGKTCVRLDCKAANAPLNDFYAALGYERAGECREGAYHGVLREKKV